MKLDPRIENESLIYTPFSKIKSKLHENGYFANDLQAFSDLKKCIYGTLVDCNLVCDYPYMCGNCTIFYGTIEFAFYIPESSLKQEEENKTDKPLTLDEVNDMCKKCMKEISELRDELHSIKYQLNKHELTEHNSANCCASISYPNGFNPQSNWCENTFEYK